MTHRDDDAAVVTAADARNRAWRTFWQGLGVDVGLAVLGAVMTALDAMPPTLSRAYWLGLGVLVVKTAIQAAVAYASRKAIPPRVE